MTPPEWFSDTGEGYCRVCHFVVPLDGQGKLAGHSRGAHAGMSKACDGSFKRPARLTPYTSRASTFKVVPPTAKCVDCGEYVPYGGPSKTFLRHWGPHGMDLCKGIGKQPPKREPTSEPPVRLERHEGERG